MAKKVPKIVKEIRDYTPQEINYAYQKVISYSQLSLYRSCPHKWALQYKDGIKVFTSSIHTVFGTALHKVIQHYLDIMYSKSAKVADELDLLEIFENNLREEYKIQYKSNNNTHFSTSEELREFFDDGVEILNYFKSKRNKYFSKRDWWLVGCEVPIVITPNIHFKNILYQGYLDVVMYHEPTNTFKIIDIKTSTRGWNDKVKKDENKQFQLILYKKYFSEQFNIPIENIEVEFFIVKRKLYENSEFVIPRIQNFSPPSGKIKLNKATQAINDFITEAFDEKGYKEKTYTPIPSKWDCTFCPFRENKEFCKFGIEE